MTQEKFEDKLFTAAEHQCAFFSEMILRQVNSARSLRFLEIGCGTGQQLFDLAEKLPDATFVGVDMSAPNIQEAESVRLRMPFAKRLTFVNGDYMKLQCGAFDVIFSHTTLHLISASTVQLFSKLATDLACDGVLVYTMPYCCAYNSVLSLVRRLFSLFRGRFTDALTLGLARILHGKSFPEQMLRDRVLYMYMLPERMIGRTLNSFIQQSFLLSLVDEFPIPHTSPGQMKHKMSVFRKRAG